MPCTACQLTKQAVELDAEPSARVEPNLSSMQTMLILILPFQSHAASLCGKCSTVRADLNDCLVKWCSFEQEAAELLYEH